jgi:diaminohydroxyphosphoribosylaminopyrimidine deaminase/5-amino-6-(5-phosphoribosylamino)uracil reductase
MRTNTWQLLLRLREQAASHPRPLNFCAFSPEDPDVFFVDHYPEDDRSYLWVIFKAETSISLRSEDTLFRSFDLLDYRLEQAGRLPEYQLTLLQQYLPYCFLRYFAEQRGRAITVAHFAQSLDGKIATHSGHSRWIGNEANLEHAHRMRALCDGILIGKNTLLKDRPQLTVRRVEGPNPVRIVIGSCIDDCSSLLKASPEPVIAIQKEPPPGESSGVRQLVYEGAEEFIPCRVVLARLFEQGIHSVLVEGGATTTSRFLNENMLDLLQLHIAPILMGSGRDSFQLPEIRLVDHAVHFKKFFFQPISNTFMFVGQPGPADDTSRE